MTVVVLTSNCLTRVSWRNQSDSRCTRRQAGWAATLQMARAGEVGSANRVLYYCALELLACEGDTARLAVDCSKGPYIRTLVEDMVKSSVAARTLRTAT